MLLVRMSLILFISLLLIIVGTLYLGYQQPDDTLLLDFQHCGDRVCVLGIAPNITPLDAALATLRSNPQLESPPDTPTQAIKRSLPFYQIVLYANPDNDSVERVDLSFQPKSLITAGQIIAKFGTPCLIAPYPLSDNAALLYPHRYVFVRPDPTRPANPRWFLPSARVAQIILEDSDARECSQLEAGSGRLSWQGFRVYLH